MKKLLMAAMITLCGASGIQAGNYTPAIMITDVGTSAEMYGLGTIQSFSKSSATIFENPAALYKIDKLSVSVFTTRIINEVDYRNIAYAHKTKYGTFGLGYMQAFSGGFPITAESGGVFVETGTFDVDFGLVKLAYQNKLKRQKINYGVGLNYYTNKIAYASGRGSNIDVGAMKTWRNFEGSLALKNIILSSSTNWSNGGKESHPFQIVLGGKYHRGYFDFMAQLHQHESYGRTLKSAGIQYSPGFLKFVQARVGYREFVELNTTVSSITAGLGLQFKGVGFDYAFEKSTHPLVDNHNYFSVKLNF